MNLASDLVPDFADAGLTEGLMAGSVVALAVAAIARHRGWNMAIPVLLVGVAVGLVPFGPQAPDNAGEIFLIILAPLVFGEALSASYLDLRRVRSPVLLLAVVLVGVGALAVGAVATLVVPSIPWPVALALGAILAPTDAVSVAAVAKRAGLPRRVVMILEGESLVNDGTGLTLLRVALVTAAVGSVTVTEVVTVLGVSILGGLGVGIVIGIILLLLIRRSRDALIANAAILLAPFPGYFLAEGVGGSGILAVVTAALIAAHGMGSTAGFRGRPASVAAWSQVTFLLQAFAFFLVGLELPETLATLQGGQWGRLPLLVAAVLLTLVGVRVAFTSAMWALTRRGRERLSLREWTVIGWAGTRGPVSGLAAFSIPVLLPSGEVFPDRNLLLATTLCVITVTLLISPSVAWCARLLQVGEESSEAELARVRRALAACAIERVDALEIDALQAGAPLPESVVHRIRSHYQAALDPQPGAVAEPDDSDVYPRVLREVLHAQLEELVRLRDQGAAPDAVIRRVQHDIDSAIGGLR